MLNHKSGDMLYFLKSTNSLKAGFYLNWSQGKCKKYKQKFSKINKKIQNNIKETPNFQIHILTY